MKTNDHRIELSQWKFQIDQEDVGESFGWYLPEHDHDAWMEVVTPGTWDFYTYALRNYEGVGWFCAELGAMAPDELRHHLAFTRVGGRAWVWVNGKFAGSNILRHLPFNLDIQDLLQPGGFNKVVIKVDNSFQGDRHIPGGRKIEWVLYGGLTHKVELIAAPRRRIEHLDVRSNALGKTDVIVTVRNDETKDFSGKLQLGLDCDKSHSAEVEVRCLAGRQTQVSLFLQADEFTPWDLENPVLYNLCASLLEEGAQLHTASERIGFRTIECQGTQILLNGKPLFVRGFNRYDEIEPYGCSAPERMIREDLGHIKHFGANLIRVHYPQDPLHLEIADELGLLYMLEVPLNWWNPDPCEKIEDYADLEAEEKATLDRTYAVFCNHPSWVFWSMSNECRYNGALGQSLLRTLAVRARQLNSGRLITNVVDALPNSGEELDFCDFIGFNLYHGVRQQVRELSEVEPYVVEPTRKALERLVELYPNKPIVVCEFGSLSVQGMTGPNRMSETRHAEQLRLTAQAFAECKNLSGMILWAWADYFHNRNFLLVGAFMSIRSLFGPYGVVTVDRKIKKAPYEALHEIFARSSSCSSVLYKSSKP